MVKSCSFPDGHTILLEFTYHGVYLHSANMPKWFYDTNIADINNNSVNRCLQIILFNLILTSAISFVYVPSQKVSMSISLKSTLRTTNTRGCAVDLNFSGKLSSGEKSVLLNICRHYRFALTTHSMNTDPS